MCNCNQKRTSVSEGTGNTRGKVMVRLVGNKPVSTNGNSTGRRYEFSAQKPMLWVDSRDAMGMSSLQELQVIY